MKDLSALLDGLEQRLAEVEELPDAARTSVFELLDAIDGIHRLTLHRLAACIDRVTGSGPAPRTLLRSLLSA